MTRAQQKTALAFMSGVTALVLAGASDADAADWRYCLATFRQQHQVVFSEEFETDMGDGAITLAFNRWLARTRSNFTDVQCPRADSPGLLSAMRSDALDFNRKLGNSVVELRWRGP